MYVRPPTSSFVGSHHFASSPPPLPLPQQRQDDEQQQQGTSLESVLSFLIGVPSCLAFGIASVVIGSVNLDNSCDYNIAVLLIVTGSLMLASFLLSCAHCLVVLVLPGEHRPAVTSFFSYFYFPLIFMASAINLLQPIYLYFVWDTRTQCGVGMYWYAMTLYIFIPAVAALLVCCFWVAVAVWVTIDKCFLTSEPDRNMLLE